VDFICENVMKAAVDSIVVAGIVGAAISLIMEMWPGWEDWPEERRFWMILALCMAVPQVALWGGVYALVCEGMAITAQTVHAAIAAGAAAFTASQATFRKYVKPRRH